MILITASAIYFTLPHVLYTQHGRLFLDRSINNNMIMPARHPSRPQDHSLLTSDGATSTTMFGDRRRRLVLQAPKNLKVDLI